MFADTEEKHKQMGNIYGPLETSNTNGALLLQQSENLMSTYFGNKLPNGLYRFSTSESILAVSLKQLHNVDKVFELN